MAPIAHAPTAADEHWMSDPPKGSRPAIAYGGQGEWFATLHGDGVGLLVAGVRNALEFRENRQRVKERVVIGRYLHAARLGQIDLHGLSEDRFGAGITTPPSV